MNADLFPRLYSSRLILRKLSVDDFDQLVRYANNRKISDYVQNIPYPYSEPDAVFRISYVHQGFKNKVRYVFAIILKEQSVFAGEIGLHLDAAGKVAQLGYWVGEPLWNMGVATEAVAAVLRFGFENLELQQIFATCMKQNEPSAKVLINNGMEECHRTESVVQYRVLRETYHKDS